MAVAHSAASQSHASAAFSVSQASFSWTHTVTANPQGVLVFVFQGVSEVNAVTSVTYDGTNIPAVVGGAAQDTATENGSVRAYFLGSSVPTTDNPTVVVNRTNNTTTMWAVAITVTAATATTEVNGIVLTQENAAVAEQSVTDGSPGSNSVRYAGVYYGGATPAPAGSNSTLLGTVNDAGAYGWTAVRETTAGQGSRLVGCTQVTSDDLAGVHLAIREVLTSAATATGSLTISGTATAKAATTASGSLDIAGTFTAKAPATATGSMSFGATASTVVLGITGSLDISGTATAKAPATASGSLDISGTAAAKVSATATGSLDVSGAATAKVSATATGSLDVSGTATAKAAATATGSLDISGTGEAVNGATNTATGSMSVSASSTAQAATGAAGALAITGTATAEVATSATGSLTVTGSVTAKATATATGSLTITGVATAAAAGSGNGNLFGHVPDQPGAVEYDADSIPGSFPQRKAVEAMVRARTTVSISGGIF